MAKIFAVKIEIVERTGWMLEDVFSQSREKYLPPAEQIFPARHYFQMAVNQDQEEEPRQFKGTVSRCVYL
jgi:hypothetical protein